MTFSVAAEPEWWSLKPLIRPEVPKSAAGISNPIDAFITAKLAELHLRPSLEAGGQTLVRRLYFDLTGLPPTPAEVLRFMENNDPQAYERLVDQLLSSPRYGERWARHWLDVVHYGDTHGYDKDQPRPNAWPYRDYVIRAFNEDRSYARFVQEQLAGDVLFPESTDGIEALGFISAGPWDLVGHAEVSESKIDGKIARHLDRDDMVANTMNTFASTTVQCAQCHNHKFDPIPQEDYYSLQAVFAAVDRTNFEYYENAEFTKKRAQLKQRESVTKDTNALAEIRKDLGAMPKPRIAFIGGIHYGTGAFLGTGAEGGKPRPIYVLPRGDVRKPGKAAEPGALSAVRDLPSRFEVSSEDPESERRKALALWLTDLRNPLTWRSIVNRVWQYHFGRGLVETPNDFGRMGAQPSHPELLDWLAVEFRDGDQSLKRLHKLIVTSAAYRQVSTISPMTAGNVETDRDNRFLWRMNNRKLEAEAVRDSVLFVSGELDERMFGPAFRDFVVEKPEHSPHYEYHLHDPEDVKTFRRSIYRFIVRSQQQPFMTALDCADPSMPVDKRNESLSALQALALLNNGFMVTMARHFAANLELEGGAIEEHVDQAFARALSRAPSQIERADLVAYTRKNGLANACRLLFNVNEFLFVD